MPENLNSPASLFIFSWESARPDDLGSVAVRNRRE